MNFRVLAISCFVAATLTLSGCGSDSPKASSPKKTVPAESTHSVAEAINKAIHSKTQLGAIEPSLASIASRGTYAYGGSALLNSSCDMASNPALDLAPTPCFFGAFNSKQTVVLFGDSFVGNWLPAMNQATKQLGMRLAVFEYSGCITPFVTPNLGINYSLEQVNRCVAFHRNLPSAVKKLSPIAVVSANGAPSWGAGNAKWPGDPSWIQGMKLAFDEITAGHPQVIRIILGTGPHLITPAPECLASANLPSSCAYRYDPLGIGSNEFAASLARDQLAAREISAQLIPTVQWQCIDSTCPVVIHGILVYVDSDHLTIEYSRWLSTVMEQALQRIIE